MFSHRFKSEIRGNKIYLILWALVLAILSVSAISYWNSDIKIDPRTGRPENGVSELIGLLIVPLVAIPIVSTITSFRLDNLKDPRAFWNTRPIRPNILHTTKFVFLHLAYTIPVAICTFIIGVNATSAGSAMIFSAEAALWCAAVIQLSALPDRNISSLATNMRQWTKEQKDQFVETYRSLEGPDKDYLSSLAIGSRSRVPLEMKSEAYAHLLTLPEDHEYSEWRTQDTGNFAVEAVSQHALDLMNSDPLQATAWLASLPEGPVRMMAQGKLALNWQNYDPKAVENWLSSLPADNQTEIKEFMKSNK